MTVIRMAALLVLALVTVPASAEQKSLRDQLVESWNFVVAEVVAPEKSFSVRRDA